MNQVGNQYSIKENRIMVGDAEMPFNFSIEQVIEVEDMLIVRLEIPITKVYNENVFGISLAEKKVKWQIAKKKYSNEQCSFTYIRIFEGELELVNWCSVYFIVDPTTGNILREGWSKLRRKASCSMMPAIHRWPSASR
jgi:hypothetical protein